MPVSHTVSNTVLHAVLRTVQEDSSNPAHDAFVEKKSEFIGNICHVTTLDEALDFVQSVKVANPKARHVAYAAICGMRGAQLCERMSDDGEPSGTAGKPILDVLRSANLTDCVVTVTRYFGGILLGSGGLTRAYAKSASMAVAAAKIVDIVSCVSFACNLKYQQLRMLQHIVNQVEGAIDSENYGVDITLNISVPTYKSEEFLLLVKNAFSGSVVPEVLCRKQMVL
ncbi:IMPACT family protein [Gardnerella sp. Marseille-Q9185]|uniref:IMPACT family protein n=1 Tax=Gardnerella sp. Marseille-Q9185 TaxID=3390094 RepID=UPI0039705F91